MTAPRICCVGELMWDFHAERGASLETAATYRRVPGGAAANVAMALVEAGVATAVSGVVADDAFGEGMRGALAARGLDVSAMRTGEGRTGLVFIEGGGVGRYLSYRPGFSGPVGLRLPHAWRRPPEGALLHVAALDPDWIDPEAYLALGRRMKRADGRLSVDVNARPRAWRRRRGIPRAMRSLLRLADVVKASTEDLAMLRVGDDPARARDALGVAGTLVVTDGPLPTTAVGRWGQLAVAPPRVTPKRTVGAGDAFCAGLLRRVVEEAQLDTEAVWTGAVRAGHARARRWLRREGDG